MSEDEQFAYRAFLSYTHADRRWAEWLHRRLENFKLDSSLASRLRGNGLPIDSLRPIFRDRDDFSGGDSLSERTVEILDSSAALLVLCSSVSATRPVVNEEVRLFRFRHPDRPVIPVIIEGNPPDNFPPALRYAIDGSGVVTKTPVVILGCDMRKEGDGKDLAFAKVVAGLVGAPADEVVKRAEIAWRRQRTTRTLAGLCSLVLALAAAYFIWHAHQRDREVAEIKTLVEKLLIGSDASATEPDNRRQPVANALIDARRRTRDGDKRLEKAVLLLKSDKVVEAEAIFREVAVDRERAAAGARRDAAAAWRHLGAIARLSDPARARDAYARAIALEPSSVEGLFWYGWLQHRAGRSDEAHASFERALSLAVPVDEQTTVWLRIGLGDIAMLRGDHSSGVAFYEEALRSARRIKEPERDAEVAVALNKLGEAQFRAGDNKSALKHFTDSLDMRRRLSLTNTSDQRAKRDVSTSLIRIGECELRLRMPKEARVHLQEALAIRRDIASSGESNPSNLRDLVVALVRFAEVSLADGDTTTASALFAESLQKTQSLASRDPGDLQAQSDLAYSHLKLSEALLAGAKPSVAQGHLVQSIEIAQRLVSLDPANLDRRSALAAANAMLGRACRALGRREDALKAFTSAREIWAALVRIDATNASWRSALVMVDTEIEQAAQ